MKLRAMLGTVGLAAAVVAAMVGSPAHAAPVPQVKAATEAAAKAAPVTLTVNGHTYLRAPLKAAAKFIRPAGAKWAVTGEAHRELSPAAYATTVAFVADANLTLGQVGQAVGAGKIKAGPAPLASCLSKLRVSSDRSHVTIRIPDCILDSEAKLLGALAGIVAVVGTLPVVTAPVAAAIAAALAAEAGVIVATQSVCDVIGPGNGVKVTYTIKGTLVYPTINCW